MTEVAVELLEGIAPILALMTLIILTLGIAKFVISRVAGDVIKAFDPSEIDGQEKPKRNESEKPMRGGVVELEDLYTEKLKRKGGVR